MIMKKFPVKAAAVILATALFAASLGGCGKKSPGYTMYSGSSKAETYDINGSNVSYTDIANYTQPEKGEEIVVMTIKDKGTVKFKLFPDLLPRACANFVGHVVNEDYNGLSFHRVIADFMIQGGDPQGNGQGGESIWGGRFDGGTTDYLCNVKGALAYANSGSTSTDGSQFYIVVGQKFTDGEVFEKYKAPNFNYTETARNAYFTEGGAPWLDGGYTVFGQVIEGMEIVEDICNNTVVDSQDKPLDDVIIEKAEVVSY
ncbi:peptidylprolyl isomerase [Ruminococcus sp. HUN007]|uniref:peptidylprolyl isomerase n=1 Tax=Ruminococcus sp. HUN007 TaxID=1514668 RepID=UPI000A48CB3D|nr:peptidylprolyl isomerase [Ruminococcus sp. HUN007]